MIEVIWKCKLENKPAGAPVGADKANSFARQLARDASNGTFAPLPEAWEAIGLHAYAERATCELVGEPHAGLCQFKLRLSTALFPLAWGGLQHLVGVLAGDLFYLQTRSLAVTEVRVESVILPGDYRKTAIELFRSSANTISEVRKSFQLTAGEPLLAWSFKPRVGATHATFRRAALDAAEAGFHIVEMDTRDIAWNNQRISEMLKLAGEVADAAGSGISRLSVNIPVPHRLQNFVEFVSASARPIVLKVDGGLDGLSICQAIRASSKFSSQKPIITCYPLLRDTLAPRVPKDFFNDLLALSGADIIYLGGRPPIDEEERSLGAAAENATQTVRSRYRSFIKQGWPMPTIAGGVHPGQLHAYYELLGPDVAYFLGGAVSLHAKGPKAGAALCAGILKEAVELRRKSGSGPLRGKLGDGWVTQCDDDYPEEVASKYVVPSEFFEKAGVKSHSETPQ